MPAAFGAMSLNFKLVACLRLLVVLDFIYLLTTRYVGTCVSVDISTTIAAEFG